MPTLNFKEEIKMSRNELLDRVGKLLGETPSYAKEVTLTVNHGELAHIFTTLFADDVSQRAREEVLMATIRKRKAERKSLSDQTDGKE